ncbi:hypothetical protein IW262DRAFT_1511050 [Armillaria fumosa]|nr:hypothetical protein IW262DRAFT_1511050 [Armillaria fumosa]
MHIWGIEPQAWESPLDDVGLSVGNMIHVPLASTRTFAEGNIHFNTSLSSSSIYVQKRSGGGLMQAQGEIRSSSKRAIQWKLVLRDWNSSGIRHAPDYIRLGVNDAFVLITRMSKTAKKKNPKTKRKLDCASEENNAATYSYNGMKHPSARAGTVVISFLEPGYVIVAALSLHPPSLTMDRQFHPFTKTARRQSTIWLTSAIGDESARGIKTTWLNHACVLVAR